jgi:hypothetical protein
VANVSTVIDGFARISVELDETVEEDVAVRLVAEIVVATNVSPVLDGGSRLSMELVDEVMTEVDSALIDVDGVVLGLLTVFVVGDECDPLVPNEFT